MLFDRCLYYVGHGYFFFFLVNKKRGSPVWAHRPHVMWRQWVIPHVSHGLCWGYRSNRSFLGVGTITPTIKPQPRVVAWILGLMDVSRFWRLVLGRDVWLAVVASDSTVGLAMTMGVDLGGWVWFCGYGNFVEIFWFVMC